MQPTEPYLLPPNLDLIEAYIMPKIGIVLHPLKENSDSNGKYVMVWICEEGRINLLDKMVFLANRKPAPATKENIKRIQEAISVFTYETSARENYGNDEHCEIDKINAYKSNHPWSDENDDYETKMRKWKENEYYVSIQCEMEEEELEDEMKELEKEMKEIKAK